jgi:hypothetical protein
LDLTRLLIVHGGQAQLLLPLCEKAGISNYRVRVRFDDITLTGCHTTGDPGFERTGRGWTYRPSQQPNRRHLERVLRVHIDHYNAQRPHRALELCPPEPEGDALPSGGEIHRRNRLGDLIHEYYRAAA